MLKPPDPYRGLKRGCGNLVSGYILLAMLLIGIEIYQEIQRDIARLPVRHMQEITQFIRLEQRHFPDASLADLIEEFKAQRSPARNPKWGHFPYQVTIHLIPPEERLGFLDKVDYYLQHENTGVLSNGVSFPLPYDAAALQTRVK